MARYASGRASSPRLLASKRAETQLNVIDVLVAFDLSAQKVLSDNGKVDPSDYALNKVREMNRCLANTRIDAFKFRLAGTVCFGEDASLIRDSQGAVDLHAILVSKFVDEYGKVVASGEWAKVIGKREELGADVVSVFVDADRSFGLSFELGDRFSNDPAQIPAFGDWAYSVCGIGNLGGWSFGPDDGIRMLHEIGHNMGCGHPDSSCASPLAMPLGPQLYSYSSGYYAWIGNEGYCTIMGYNFGGLLSDGSYDPTARFIQLPCFSSPALIFGGVALGTSHNDNRQTLLSTYAYVAQYRASNLPADASDGMDVAASSGTVFLENGRVFAPIYTDATSDTSSDNGGTPTRVFSTEFRPVKAVNGVAPYVGAAYDGGKPVAIISLKCAKAATSGAHAGTSKVSAAVTGLDGKLKKSSVMKVACGYDAKATLEVRQWGLLSLTLGGEGFVGTLGSGYSAKTASVGGAWPHASAVVDVDFGVGTGSLPTGTLADLLPTGKGAEPVLNANGKWGFAPAATVKYALVKDKTTYELQGVSDPKKTNRSAMKLRYNAKKGTFSGSFKVYALDTSGTKPRLRKHSAKVSGIVVDSVGYGKAEIKNAGSFPVTVGPRQ